MATLVTFYALTATDVDTSEAVDDPKREIQSDIKSASENVTESEVKKAAQLVLASTQKRIKTTVLCSTQAQAEAVDEFIWQYPPESFIPHNLYGEGPAAGTLAEIIWQTAYASMTNLRNRSLLINLSGEFIDEYQKLKHIIDFVPVDEQLKVAARTRYKRYKQAGCQLEYKNV